MRVLHVISDENVGGAGVLLTSLLKNFDPEQVQSTVALPEGSALCARIEGLGVPCIPLKHSADRLLGASTLELCRLIRRERPDIVHTNAAVCARVAARVCHVPVLHTRHCCFPPSGIWRLGAFRAIGGACNRSLSDLVIATAEAAKHDLLLFGIPEEKIRVIPNGSEPVRSITEAERRETMQKWGLLESDFTVGIAARLVACKGHRIFLDAAKRLCERAPEIQFRFLLAGEGPLKEELEAYARALGIADRVVFTGFLDDMAAFYRVLRVNVNCSVGTETSCLALSEGMSASVPCVVSDYGGNTAMVGDSLAGWVYPAGDAVALMDRILQIAANAKLEAAMRQAAGERYFSCYTASAMARAVETVYRELKKK